MNMARYDWGFRTEPEPHLGGRTPRHARAARCSAAPPRSTAWSTSAATRATSTTGPRWAPTAGPSPTSLPYFQRMENWHGGHSDWRGTDGPLHVTRGPRAQPALPHLRRGRRPGRLRAHLRLQRRRSRKASARWSRPSGAAAAGRPPTPTCARRSRGGNVARRSRPRRPRRRSRDGRATGVEIARGARPRDRRRPPRGHPLRLLDQHAEAADALRHRPGRAPRRARHPGRRRPPGRRRATCRTTSSSTSRCRA